MVKALFKFDKNIPKGAKVVDTTSNSRDWSGLSPFILPAPPAKRFENLWQFSKVYKQHLDTGSGMDGWMSVEWYQWQKKGFDDPIAHRYPMGKGAIPEFTYWNDEKLGYIEARKKLYIPEYSKNVVKTSSFKLLQSLYESIYDNGITLILLDYDAYDHQALGLTLKDVVNNPKRKCGHAFVLISLLTGEEMISP